MNLDALVKRARLQNVTSRASDLDDLRAMLNGTYSPAKGWIAPSFDAGTPREEAWNRALRTVSPPLPLVMNKTIAGLDFGSTTWSDDAGPQVDDLLHALDLPALARSAAIEYRLTGSLAMMASTPETEEGEPTDPVVSVMRGVNIPYTDPRDQATIQGWYRAIQYVSDATSKLAWWVEVYDFQGDSTIHRIWKSLQDPTALAATPDDEFTSQARPRFALYDLQPDGLPVSPMLAGMGHVMGLYSTLLRLSASEEMSAYPMLLIKGDADFVGVGPGEVLVSEAEEGAGAEWMDPGNLEQLREQASLKRDMVREVFNLPGGSLGAQTPSGEALAEANRGFMQESHRTADAVSRVLTDAVSDYLALNNLPAVEVSVPIDRSYAAAVEAEILEKGLDYGVVPQAVAARKFQQFLGSGAYSDEELEEFQQVLREREMGRSPGELMAVDEA